MPEPVAPRLLGADADADILLMEDLGPDALLAGSLLTGDRSRVLFAFYDWCARNDDTPGLLSLARTVSRREDQIVCAVLAGVTNAASESLNRLARLEARLAYGFRNPAN